MAVIKKFRIKSFKNINSVIEFENISLAYGNRLILDNINFKINEGQIFGMLGPNGVGKSTIFNNHRINKSTKWKNKDTRK